MGHKDTIISYITENNGFYCDDCLSNLCSISPRQTVFQVCKRLSVEGKINRKLATCSHCVKEKTVNSKNDMTYRDNVDTDITYHTKIDKKEQRTIRLDEYCKSKNNEFIEILLEFDSFDIKDIFATFNAHTLAEILTKDKYIKFRDECYGEYKNYINMELGLFLYKLKQNNNMFYKRFLNLYGDQLYCKFKMEKTSLAKCKGLYMYKHNEQIKYIGRVKGNFDFYQRINAGYANISPKNCYIDGQATNCHINAIINRVRSQVKFFIMPLKDDEEICFLERKLIEEHKPEWNIALK
ncbi:MAG TPA: hypothetical protein VIM70_23235 [Clostridium sp.]|uniref:hypothetical protein n=1 Tax=Clostridium sp. TaxID=1506 RepID=UPI002F95A5EF